MNKSLLFSRLAITGIITLGTSTLVIPQKANAGTVYGFSKLEWEANVLLGDQQIIFFDPESDTRATLNGVTETGFDPFNGDGFSNSPQSYVDNNGIQNSTIVPENTFNPPQGSFLTPGGIGPDFVRGDAYACDINNTAGQTCLDFFPNFSNNIVAANVAELYIEAPQGGPLEAGIGEGEWDLLSVPITPENGDVLNIDTIFTYDVVAAITGFEPGGLKEIQSVLEWDLEVINTETGQSVGGIGFQTEEGLSGLNLTDRTSDTGVTDSLSITFGDGDDDSPFGIAYEIVITGEERVTGSARQNNGKIPEPTTILGLLTVSSLGLSLKHKNKLSKPS